MIQHAEVQVQMILQIDTDEAIAEDEIKQAVSRLLEASEVGKNGIIDTVAVEKVRLS